MYIPSLKSRVKVKIVCIRLCSSHSVLIADSDFIVKCHYYIIKDLSMKKAKAKFILQSHKKTSFFSWSFCPIFKKEKSAGWDSNRILKNPEIFYCWESPFKFSFSLQNQYYTEADPQERKTILGSLGIELLHSNMQDDSPKERSSWRASEKMMAHEETQQK